MTRRFNKYRWYRWLLRRLGYRTWVTSTPKSEGYIIMRGPLDVSHLEAVLGDDWVEEGVAQG